MITQTKLGPQVLLVDDNPADIAVLQSMADLWRCFASLPQKESR
jgi:hypothetical protein